MWPVAIALFFTLTHSVTHSLTHLLTHSLTCFVPLPDDIKDKNERMNNVLRTILSVAVGGTGLITCNQFLRRSLTKPLIYTGSSIRNAFERRVAVNVVKNISQVSDSRIVPFLSLLCDISPTPIIEGAHSLTHSLTH